jgi:hypothetical protein
MISFAVVEGRKMAVKLFFVEEGIVFGKRTAVGECTVTVDCRVVKQNLS